MKKAVLLIFVISALSFSQNKQVLYGFTDIPQSLLLNPGGKVTNNWFFGIPLLSHIHANVGGSGATIYDVFAVDGVDFNDKLRRAVYGMNANDFYTATQQLEVVSGGFAFGKGYEKNKYLSFGIYTELDVIGYMPKDYAVLAYEGNHDNIGRYFNLGHLNAKADFISVFHVGYNKQVNEDFIFGFRGKIYSSVVSLNSTKNQGYFVTLNGRDNIYNHIFNLDLELSTSGLASITDDESEDDFTMKDLQNRLLLGGNLGLGFDMGFSYRLSDQWTVDGSLLDIGFIRHSKDVENYKLEGQYALEGINPVFPEAGEGQTGQEYWDEIKENFENLFEVDTTHTKFTTWRPVKLNASINYAFGKDKNKDCNCVKQSEGYQNAAGLQLYAIKRPRRPQAALTAYYYRKLFNGLSTKVTYTIDSYSFYNFGLGFSTNIKGLNFYVMADNFIEYRNVYNAQSLSLQFGFNYIFNKNED
ncbi:MAG: DUF5723 family protein [Aestuariibaculum sp.]